MTKVKVVKYFKGPAFTAEVWSINNPILLSGEIGYLLQGGVTIAAKVGPGRWNELGFIGEDIYNYSQEVTNPIGDATGNIQGTKVVDILNKMLTPYEVPDMENMRLVVNSGITPANTVEMEIGQSVTSLSIIYNMLNSQNLSGATPINITPSSGFSIVNAENTGSIFVPIISPPFQPSLNTTVTFIAKMTHQRGQTNGIGDSATLVFNPRIMWMSTSLINISDGNTFMAQSGIQFIRSSNFKRDYNFPSTQFAWIAIPAMLSPSNLSFAEISNLAAPSNFSFIQQQTISIYNGVGTYNYVLYRSTYRLQRPTKLKIS